MWLPGPRGGEREGMEGRKRHTTQTDKEARERSDERGT